LQIVQFVKEQQAFRDLASPSFSIEGIAMSLLDLVVIGLVLLLARFIPVAWGVVAVIVIALIIERVLVGERLPLFQRRPAPPPTA
jgi:hypothetical protein